jgi:integrase
MPSISFRDFATEVLSTYQAPSRRPSTRSKISQILKEFGPSCSSTSDLTVGRICDWLAGHPDRRAITHRSLLSTLRAICAYGAFRGYMANPFDFRKLSHWLPADELAESEPEVFRRHRTAAEVRLVLERADLEATTWKGRRLRDLFYTYAFTGAGKLEVLGARVIDVDLVKGILSIRSHPIRRLKTGARVARLPLVGPMPGIMAGRVAESARDGSPFLFPHTELAGPWFHGRPGYKPLDQIKALGLRAGVEGLTILSLRHTVGTLAEGWGIGELMLQRLLRHSRPATQRHYRHEDLDQLRRAAERITYTTEEHP